MITYKNPFELVTLETFIVDFGSFEFIGPPYMSKKT